MTLPFGDFTITIISESEDYEPEPFSIIAFIKTANNARYYHVACNDIPCDLCPVQPTCKGINQSKAIAEWIKDNCSEVLI